MKRSRLEKWPAEISAFQNFNSQLFNASASFGLLDVSRYAYDFLKRSPNREIQNQPSKPD
jgi:hypothetical protein